MAEDRNETAGRAQRQEEKPQQRGLSRARRPGEKLKGTRVDAKAHIAQDFRPRAIAQTYMLEPDHVAVPSQGVQRRCAWANCARVTVQQTNLPTLVGRHDLLTSEVPQQSLDIFEFQL